MTNFAKHWHLLETYLRPRRVSMLLLTGTLLSGIGLELLNPQIVRRFIDTALNTSVPASAKQDALLVAGGVFIGVVLLQQLFRVATTYLSQDVAWQATNDLRADLARHCLKLDLRFHSERTPGELIERVDNDVQALANFFSEFTVQILGNGLLVAGIVILLAIEDWRLGLALALFVVVALAIMFRVNSLAVALWGREEQARADFMGFAEERMAGAEDIRSSDAVSFTLNQLLDQLRSWFRVGYKVSVVGNYPWMTTLFVFGLGNVLVFGIGAWLFAQGRTTIGTLYLVFNYFVLIFDPLQRLRSQLGDLQHASASITRVNELMDRPSEIIDAPMRQLTLSAKRQAVAVEFRDVSFHYVEQAPVLRDVSFDLKAGEVLGVIGRTGSGKSTLAKLLLRLYEPQSGTICLDGQPLQAFALHDLRRAVGLITQDVQLFKASVRDNVTAYDDAITDDAVRSALLQVGLSTWVESLPSGLNTLVGPGNIGLSAGQAQLLAFARILVRDPAIVVLDEPSSRLDPITEALTERAMTQLLQGRTGIIIAHRLATLRRVDAILVIDQGQIVELGDRQLLEANPQSRFAQLLESAARSHSDLIDDAVEP